MSSLNNNILESTVINGGYCLGCGACAVPLNSPYRMQFSQGKYVPVAVECQKSGHFVHTVCPFSDSAISEDEIARNLFKNQLIDHDTRIGYYGRLGAMWANDDKERLSSSSGGVVTWVSKYMLQSKIVDAIIHVQPKDPADDSRLFKYVISDTVEGVEFGRSSRYYPVSMDEVVRLALTDSRRFAFVGLPCFVKALRLLTMDNHALAERIPYTIGLVCGHLKTAGFSELFAAQVGIAPKELKAINFRVKLSEYPSSKYGIEVVSGLGPDLKKITVPNFQLFGADWGHSFFKQKGCDFCDDIFAETADLVVGDAWLPGFKDEWRGTSIVLTRSKALDDILTKGVENQQLSFVPLSVTELAASQRANFSHRRDALPYRLEQVDKQGTWRPKKRFEVVSSPLNANRAAVIDLRGKLANLTQGVWLRVRDISPVSEAFRAFKEEVQPVVDELEFMALRQGAEATSLLQRFICRTKSTLVDGLTYVVRQVRKVTASPILRSKMGGQIMILPPASPGSLGDEAVLTATLSHLKSIGRNRFTFLSYSAKDDWGRLKSNIISFQISNYINYRSPRTALELLFKCFFAERLIICGTDVLDGHHNLPRSLGRLAIADLVADSGVPVTIIGSSFSEEAAPAARHSLRLLRGKVVMCPRDPISFDVVKPFLHEGVRLVADPAFLLPAVRAASVNEKITPWVEEQRRSGGVVLGFNANHFLAQGTDGDAVVSAFSAVLLSLAQQYPELSICLIPHDVRGNPSDIDLAKAILERIQPVLGTRCVMVPEGLAAGEIKDVVSQLDVVFSGKMHLSIAALGSTIPVGCITYKDKKFLGLFTHFGIEDWLLPESAWRDEKILFDFLKRLVAERITIKEKIIEELPRIKNLSENNFSDFLRN